MKKYNEIILNIIVLFLGIALVLWADKVTKIVSILLGVIAIMYAIIEIVNYFKKEERIISDTIHFTYAIIIAIVGFILIFRVDFLKELISFVVGIYIVLSGILSLGDTLSLKKAEKKDYKPNIILSIITIALGILCIIGKFLITDAIVIFIGTILIIYSLISITNYILIKRGR